MGIPTFTEWVLHIHLQISRSQSYCEYREADPDGAPQIGISIIYNSRVQDEGRIVGAGDWLDEFWRVDEEGKVALLLEKEWWAYVTE